MRATIGAGWPATGQRLGAMAACRTIGLIWRRACAAARALLPRALFDPYRPERHYMRGPGPRSRECRARETE